MLDLVKQTVERLGVAPIWRFSGLNNYKDSFNSVIIKLLDSKVFVFVASLLTEYFHG